MLFCFTLCLIAWAIYFVITKKSTLDLLKQNFVFETEMNYQGLIRKKYIDNNNHGATMVLFTNGDSIGINTKFWGQMQEGDSISKVKGDSIIHVFRGGERINIEIAPFYRKAIQKEIEKRNK